MHHSTPLIFASLIALGAGHAAADTTRSNEGAATMEQHASPSHPAKQDEERTEAHSQPDVPHSGGATPGSSSAAPAQGSGAGNASEGASKPQAALPSTRQVNRANNANYYQSGAFNEIHPEEAYPDNLPRLAAPGEDSALIEQVQQKLRAHGFDAGPVNGDFGSKTQAALAQFQLSQNLPVSGGLDSPTLNALGVVAGMASGDASAELSPPARPSP